MRSFAFAAALGAHLFWAGSNFGAEGRFIVAPLAERSPENGREVLVIVTDENRFSMVVPRGWNVTHQGDEKRITFSRDESVLTIRFGKAQDPSGAAEKWLEELRSKHHEAEILDRPLLKAFSTSALSYDLQWRHAEQFLRVGRFARVELPANTVDFALICPPEAFGEHLSTMMQLMLTMRCAGADERVVVPTLPQE